MFALLDPDPDQGPQINADPCGSGSGSATLCHIYIEVTSWLLGWKVLVMWRASLSSRRRKSATLSTEARHSPIMLMAKGKKRVMDSRTVLYSASARNAFSAVSTFTGVVA